MKQASHVEIIMARLWNLLNEGKPFTPIFVVSTFVLYHMGDLDAAKLLLSLIMISPVFFIYYVYDFPLHLRWFLWVPFAVAGLLFGIGPAEIFVLAVALFVFFTVFFWGTLYYHLRIGTPWTNFLRIWKLFLLNTDSTSGNVGEQLPKIFLQLLLLQSCYTASAPFHFLFTDIIFSVALGWFSWIIHRRLFNWKPKEYPAYIKSTVTAKDALAKRMVIVVIDGCRKERLYEANAPFLHQLMSEGTVYEQMETIYPARTVTCFSSMFTGTYTWEHGIKSNMVWNLGVKVESVFDVLKKQGRKGVLFGCAHLIDAFGDHVESFTAVAHNDVVDKKIMEQAKRIYEREEPDLFVVQMIAVDQTGHSRGVLYPEYLQKIQESDALIDDFYHWLAERGSMEDTAFLVMADHGQGNGIGGHGHLDTGERFVPFFLHGPMIQQGKVVQEKRSIVSLAATISALLGVPIPEHSRGPILDEALKENEGKQHEEVNRRYSSL